MSLIELSSGKVKTVWSTDQLGEVIIEYHDKVTAGNGLKEDYPEGKGGICCEISSLLFEKLEQAGVNTHYIGLETPTRMLCKKVGIVPIEVIVRNVVAGSLCRQTYLREGIALNPPLVEFYLKDDDKNDPLLTIDPAQTFLTITSIGTMSTFLQHITLRGSKMTTTPCGGILK